MITASEDGTAKLWDLNNSSIAGLKTGGGSYDDNGKVQFPSTGIADIEPLYTFRGHRYIFLNIIFIWFFEIFLSNNFIFPS